MNYLYQDINHVVELMNRSGRDAQPFLFAFDYELQEALFVPNPKQQHEVLFSIRGEGTEEQSGETLPRDFVFSKSPESFETYQKRFSIIRDGLLRGDSFLTNLTVQTPLKTNLSLYQIYAHSSAIYKLLLPNRFVCFSPERFVKIENGYISSNPMKGTIDASVPNAEQMILDDYKEKAEHFTIVDLIRNDLSRVATHVHVERFRYIDRLRTSEGELLQVSSEIVGALPDDYQSKIGTILLNLLPAGSISGAPKEATCRLIKQAEQKDRGFYSGVFGYFDGQRLDSGVLIRYIEQCGDDFYFRSGGGITVNSDARAEYEEVIQKVYLAF